MPALNNIFPLQNIAVIPQGHSVSHINVNQMSGRKRHLNRVGHILFLSLFLFLLIAISSLVISATATEPAFSEQLSFTLDPDAPQFNYSLNKFNDSATQSNITFQMAENKTIGIILPKNSTITKAEFNLTGIIHPYKQRIETDGATTIRDLEIGELISSSYGQEIGIASEESQDKSTIFVANRTGDVLWERKASVSPFPSHDGAIGDFIGSSGNEFIVGGESYGIRVYDPSGNIIWNYTTGSAKVYALALGNMTYGSENELVYGDENGLVAILNTSSNTTGSLCNFSTGSAISSLAISDIDEDGQNEILAAGDKLYILDSACSQEWNCTTGTFTINSLAVGNITADAGKEIILGTEGAASGGNYYLLNSSGSILWNRTHTDKILSVAVGEFDHDNPGPDIFGGTEDYYLHLLDSTGSIYWTYQTDRQISAIAIGNVSEDTGSNINETIIGTMGGAHNLQILNFDSFPTNLTLDIGGDQSTEWNYTEGDGRLRNSTTANNIQILAALNNYLKDNCTQDLCTVPILFHSEVEGKLEVRLNITYTYNASSDISYENIPYWTKTSNIRVNESIIARAKNITFKDPTLNITIKYIRINSSALQCGFDGTDYTNANINSINYCNISSLNPQFKTTPQTYQSKILWDDQMEKEIPVTMNAGLSYYTTGMDNYFWRKNITISSNNTYTTQSFTNITANTTLNDSSDAVRGSEYLNVTWGAETCNIIPGAEQPTCDTSPPATQMTCNSGTFYVCKKDTNSNGIFDFIKWLQPVISAIETIFYQAGGSSNMPPNMSNANVSPEEDAWNSNFNYSIHINDTETDNVNISLYTYSELLDTWLYRTSKNTTIGSGVMWFNISLEKEMTGTQNKYRFRYQDFNTTWSPIHSPAYTGNYTGPNVTKHDIEITEITGNNTDVLRSDSINTTHLVVRVNDTTQNEFIDETSVLCTFNVTNNSADFREGYITTVNKTGHCNCTFAPDSTYGVGPQTWLVTIDPRYYFAPSPQVNWTLNIIGKLNISLAEPTYNQTITRNATMNMTARIINQYNETITSATLNTANYNCSWYFNSTYIGTSAILNNGYCNYTYIPDCIYELLKDYGIEVKLNYTKNPKNYTVISNTSQITTHLKDNLTIIIDSPANAVGYYKGETVPLNSTINDTCNTCSKNSRTISWYKNIETLIINISETGGLQQNNTPVIITGSELEAAGADITGWLVNSTKITRLAETIPNRIFGADGNYINSTSKIVFLANLTPYSTNTYNLSRSEPQVSGTYTTSYIENGGFEGNSKDSWTGDGTVVSDSAEPKGNYSLKLFAYHSEEPQDSITQTFYPLTTGNVKIWYRQEGQFDSIDNPNVNVTIGNYLCKLPLEYPTDSNYDGPWRTYTCNDTSIIGTENITISLTIYHTITSGSTLYIDHICVADNTGNCISEDYGLSNDITITTRGLINTTATGDTSWAIPLNQPLGKRKITAEAAGDYYYTASDTTEIYIYGHSSVATFDFASTGCDGSFCFSGSEITLTCKVTDANTTAGIFNYSVDFYDGAAHINTGETVYTSAGGTAVYVWDTNETLNGDHTISCNISDSAYLYYNTTAQDSNSTSISIFSNETNATLSFKEGSTYHNHTYKIAYNLSKGRTDTINISVFINNTGESIVSSPEIIGYNRTGISILAGTYSAISLGGNYTANITINVSRCAPLGNTSLNITLIWANNATPFINQTITINVTNTTILDITNKTPIEHSIPYGGTKQIGNFTIEAYGNTPLENITFTLDSGDYQKLQNWTITYSDKSFDIDRFGNKTITVTVTAPPNASLLGQSFWAYLIANSTGTTCMYGYERCTDKIKINITVIDQDWQVTPLEKPAKTIALDGKELTGSFDDIINITSLNNQNLTINISIINFNSTGFVSFTYIFNSTQYPLNTTESTFLIPPYSFANINITFNITDATTSDTGTYTFNITLHTLDSDFVPQWFNKTVIFTISALYVEIISPNASSRATDIVAGDALNFTLNITHDGNVLNDTENTTFDIKISGQNCAIISSRFIQAEDAWFLNCTAPQIPGNQQNNSVDATVTYNTSEGSVISYTATEENLIEYRDITTPSINQVRINSVPLEPQNEANIQKDSIITINLEINATDNVAVKNVWLIITDPQNSITNLILTQNTSNPDFWNCTYSNPDIIGDYKVTIYANDSIENHTTTRTVWFDVYEKITFNDTLKDASGKTITADIDLYKSGTDWLFHSFSTNAEGFYNWSIHKRTYDIKIAALGQTVRFNNFNITSSAINKTNQSNPTSLTGAIRLHLIPNNSQETNASRISLPNTAENTLMAFIIHTPQMDYDNATIELHYHDALLASTTSYDESKLRIYYCTSWNFSTQVCTGGQFTELNSSLKPETVTRTFTFTTIHNSAYALAKWCDGNICGASPPADPDSPGSGSDGGSGAAAKPECGNGICEIGENEENCPFDCAYHVCGNGICEPTENKDNCPLDCSDIEFEYRTDTDFTSIVIAPAENITHTLTIQNNNNNSIPITIATTGDIRDYMDISETEFTLPALSNKKVNINIRTQKDTIPGTYSGGIKISSGKTKQTLPVVIKVSKTTTDDLRSLEMSVGMVTKKVIPQDTLRFHVMLHNLGIIKDFNVTLRYSIKEAKTDKILKTEEETIHLTGSTNLMKSIDLEELDPPIPNGQYFIEVTAHYSHKKITATDTFEVVESFWATTTGQRLIALILLILLAVLSWYAYKRYRLWKLSKARYVFPLDYSKLPHAGNAFRIGKIAETDKIAYFNPDDLTTHILASGSTGAGKSVAASVIVEEALKQKIPVIVFDPTAQWTGFVRPCKDNNLLRYYPNFKMRPEDARPFTGMIFEVTDPNVKIDIKKYMNPGEVTVFTLNKLKPGEYDTAVQCIIDTIFSVGWEESTTLKMVIVFDEVHRLLEKYGGKGGYISLEKACREFRKWGLGMIMCSQVYSDFKEAIQGNILTEIQLNTKSMADIAKVKEKYGASYSEKISRQGVGVGMLQNPKYNDGKPWFIQFRPAMHSPHKITEEELNIYKNFAEQLEKIEAKIEKLKAKNINIMDFELELKLAKTKLKQGQFKMAEIYIESLSSHKILARLND
ncbi:MAG: DUF87 domain-containing protein [archaeon]|nr:DUF87 domain-containing protein [archaeon]